MISHAPAKSWPLGLVVVPVGLLVGFHALAQSPSLSGDPGISNDRVDAIEKELMAEMPELAPIGDPKRVEQLWTFARRLLAKRAYCRAVKYLQDIETMTGEAISDNQSASAQAFFMCARTRFGQGDVEESEKMLARAEGLVRDRPEYRDLKFKLALIHAKQQMETEDIEAMRHYLTEAQRLGVDMGPGRADKLAGWAIPVLQNAISEISAWSHELLKDETKHGLADEASKLCIEFNPRDKIARQVQRELGLTKAVAPVGIGIGALILAIIGWQLFRRFKMRRTANDEIGLYDDVDDMDGLDDADDVDDVADDDL